MRRPNQKQWKPLDCRPLTDFVIEFSLEDCDNGKMYLKSGYFACVAGICLLFTADLSSGQGTAFLYQGQLGSGGSPAIGNYNFTFTLYNAVTNGTPVSGTLTNYDVPVNKGLFTTTLDFGTNEFTGPSIWLQIGVCTNGQTNFTTLSPLQPVLPTPYAIFANSASHLVGVLAASQLSGTLPSSAFAGYTNTVALTNGGNLFDGSFTGNGGAVTNVNVTNLTGVLADSQLPNNTAYLNSNQTFTANNTFNGANVFTNLYGNSFSGSFFGNGLVGWTVVSGASVQAQIDHGYLLTDSQLVTVTLPATANPGDIVRIACAGASGWQLAQNASQSVVGNFMTYAKTWRQSGAQALNWTSIASSSDGTRLAAAGYSSDIYLSTDSGKTWTGSSADNAGTLDWTGVASSSDGTILAAVAADNGIYVSSNSGSTWKVVGSASVLWDGVASSASGSNLVASTYGSYLYVSANGGTSWSQGENASGQAITASWTAVASSASGSQMYATYIGGIYSSANSGVNWSATGAPGDYWVAIASSANGTRLIAAATNSTGGVYISSNSGASWSQVLPTGTWTAVASSSDGGKLVAVTKGGAVYTSSNWGASWQNNAMTAQWESVASSSDGSTVAAGINNTVTTSGLYGIYTAASTAQMVTTAGANGSLSGSQGSAAELQYIGNNQFMPVSFSGTLWAQ